MELAGRQLVGMQAEEEVSTAGVHSLSTAVTMEPGEGRGSRGRVPGAQESETGRLEGFLLSEAPTCQGLKKGNPARYFPTQQNRSQGWTFLMPDQPVCLQASRCTKTHSTLKPDIPLSYNPVTSKKVIFCLLFFQL